MPPALLDHASPPDMLKDTSREMDKHERNRALAVYPAGDDAIAPKRKQYNKQSWEFVWRNAVAGGLAGSAVRPENLKLF